MTERLYYDDPYLVQFSARVVERLDWDDQPAVVLDRTAFYPTGGGQPHDTGSLQEAVVVEVLEREPTGDVVHVLDRPLGVDEVDGSVDWDRRFDLMQQHTGQHILSAAFLERLEAATVGFHLSGEYSTIDLDRAPLSSQDLQAVEEMANAVVFENRRATARWVRDEDVSALPLRKPLAHEGPVRVVEIPESDCSACGGTHVHATGEVGIIKLTRSERRGAETRVEFLCGRRALADYAAKNELVMDLARDYTVSHRELAEMVHRLADDLKQTRRELRRTRDALLDAEAKALWHEAGVVEQVRVVRALYVGRDANDLKHLALRLVEHPGTVALLAAGGETGQKGAFTFACSPDLDLHMGSLVREACQAIGGGGGGRPQFAQGGGPHGERADQGLEAAYLSLTESLNTDGDARG